MPDVLRKAQSLIALLGILLLAILMSPTGSSGSRIFLQAGNLTDILRQISLIGIIALAMTFVILTGGIDGKFITHYSVDEFAAMADDPPPTLVERLTKRFLDTDGDLKEVATTLIVLLVSALLAVVPAAVRASRVSPMVALRED